MEMLHELFGWSKVCERIDNILCSGQNRMAARVPYSRKFCRWKIFHRQKFSYILNLSIFAIVSQKGRENKAFSANHKPHQVF